MPAPPVPLHPSGVPFTGPQLLTVLRWRERGGYTLEEIAEKLELSTESIKRLLSSARRHRSFMQRRKDTIEDELSVLDKRLAELNR